MADTRLYDLLPSLYRLRDAAYAESEVERPLFALAHPLQQQMDVFKEHLDQFYDDAFIETCAEWAIPYLADLIGYQPLHQLGGGIVGRRAEVANTIGYRRRKGTATMLEQLARDVTGWDARVVEFFDLLMMAQHMNHIRRGHPGTPDLRDWTGLERIAGPFDGLSHTVDVRRIAQGARGYNLPNVGVFLWRLQDRSLTDTPAVAIGNTFQRFVFDPLGCDRQLSTKAEPEEEIAHLATELNVPSPIGRRVLDQALEHYYGTEKSFALKLNGALIPSEDIRICDLSDADATGKWAHVPVSKLTVDPVLGRIAFPPLLAPETKRDVTVTYHYVFGADLGGGEYEREASFAEHPPETQIVHVPKDQPRVQDALNALGPKGGIVQIGDSGRYVETLLVRAPTGQIVEVRAANDKRPTIVLNGPMTVTGESGAQVYLNGLLISGGTVEVEGNLKRCVFTHTTLVPGISLNSDGSSVQPDSPSLIVRAPGAEITIERSIAGGIRTTTDTALSIRDSIVDGGARDGVAIAGLNVGPLDAPIAGGHLTIAGSTIVGRIHVEGVHEVSNVIVAAGLRKESKWASAPVLVNRRQEGCIRFSYVPAGSRTPRRYRCQPDLAVEQAIDREKRRNVVFPLIDQDALRSFIQGWLVPSFTSLRYGSPAYGQLSSRCPHEIGTGADDESEMGVYCHVKNPQRLSNLRTRLGEYLPIGLEAGTFFVS